MTLISFESNAAISSVVIPFTLTAPLNSGYSTTPVFKTVNRVDSRVGMFASRISRTSPTPTRYMIVAGTRDEDRTEAFVAGGTRRTEGASVIIAVGWTSLDRDVLWMAEA